MPFGCLAMREGRSYDSVSDFTEKYEIGEVLRAKEFCELCLAKDRRTEQMFVCKKFLKKDGRKVRRAAKNEILILKLVVHPNILQLIDTYETRKEYFIIQELATGGDVFDWIHEQGNYTEKDASDVIRQVLEAVAYLHSLNIVHRNLKLENLTYYTKNNHNKVVLRDFYLSCFENGPITEPCGTPEYLAPEVVARHRYGRPVDCWAVGVIMYILLSGNPPFYDETEEENTDLHNRIIFCRIVAGDFEFDSPYWDNISPSAKELICQLMEVDQMLRITAQDALWHKWIAGNAASETNLKDGVCAQFEKNFAKAKWRKAIRVATFMQRLKNSEALAEEAQGSGEAGDAEAGQSPLPSDKEDMGKRTGPETSSSVLLEVTVENASAGSVGHKKETATDLSGTSQSDYQKLLYQTNGAVKGGGQDEAKVGITTPETTPTLMATQGPTQQCDDSPHRNVDKRNALESAVAGKHQQASQEKKCITSNQLKDETRPNQLEDETRPNQLKDETRPNQLKDETRPNQLKDETRPNQPKDENGRSWCQTQVPEAVTERSELAAVAPVTGPGTGLLVEGCSGRSNSGGTGRYSAVGPTPGQACYTVGTYAGLGCQATPYNQEATHTGIRMVMDYTCPYSSLYSSGGAMDLYGTAIQHRVGDNSTTSDWQMDSVIEQIEKQMVEVLGKIEEDMPLLLEQINDGTIEQPRDGGRHASPASSKAQHFSTSTSATPPPHPTSPRPTWSSLPPPSHPPAAPPSKPSATPPSHPTSPRPTVSSLSPPSRATKPLPRAAVADEKVTDGHTSAAHCDR